MTFIVYHAASGDVNIRDPKIWVREFEGQI